MQRGARMLMRGATRTDPVIGLVGSLVFALGQLGVGGWLVARGLGQGRWRRMGVALAALGGVWLVWSGATELFVSGMELSERLGGGPSGAAFALWRGRADTLLFAVTVALALLALGVVLVARRAAWRRQSARE